MSKRKQYKGVKYITDAIRKYGSKKRFPTYKSAQEEARDILDKIKKENEGFTTDKEKRITIKRVMSFVRKKREGDLLPLPPEMTDVNDYFILVQYPDFILTQVDKRIKIISKVSPEGLPPIQGGTEPDFDLYFRDFVEYCNKLTQLMSQKTGKPYSSGTDFFVKTTEPNEDRISYIIPCDGDGDLFKFGWDPKNPKKDPDGLITSDKPKPKDETKPEDEKPPISGPKDKGKEDSDRVKEIRKIIEGQEAKLERIKKEYLEEKLIDKKTYLKERKQIQDNIASLISKLEKGGKI